MDRQEQNTGLLDTAKNFLARKGRRAWPLRVLSKNRIAPHMTRVEFYGPDLDELMWTRGQDVVLEIPTDCGIARRHYTIRDHDAARRTLTIDFLLHGEGASGPWLDSLRTGDDVTAVGPRGHTYLRPADWHFFCGDETCIPGIFAMLESLPFGTKAFAFIEVDSEADIIPPRGSPLVNWVFRNGATPGPSKLLYDAIEEFVFPQGYGFAYVIGETSNVRAIRHRLIERGIPRDRIASEGYWRPGRVGGHDHV
jgi:NADPH-dependent ferric siderophore reductase